MKIKLYGATLAIPRNFPDDIELEFLPVDASTGLSVGGFITFSPNRTWQWILDHNMISIYDRPRIESQLQEGLNIPIQLGETPIDGLPDHFVIPEHWKSALRADD